MVLPYKKEFLASAHNGGIPPVSKEIPFRAPHEYYSVIKGKNSFLLESIKGPFTIARYSFIGFDPYIIFRFKDSSAHIEIKQNSFFKKVEPDFSDNSKKPLSLLKQLVKSYNQAQSTSLPPFQGGAVGMLSYDFVRYLEEIPKSAKDDINIPDANFFLVDRIISFDHKEKRAWIVYCPGAHNMLVKSKKQKNDWGALYDEAVDIIESNEKMFARELTNISKTNTGQAFREFKKKKKSDKIEIEHGVSKAQYGEMVKRVLAYIAAGDIFQANISLRLSASTPDIDTWDLYRRLSSRNPSPFAGYFDFGDYQIVSSSPERLVKVNTEKTNIEKGSVETRPIAGTRPRGKDRKEDNHMKRLLLLNEKERAEHIMLIDLERNDMGRVCDYGTVFVNELMTTEEYSHVIHIVSNIYGKLDYRRDCFSVMRALFPGGTITGVPKVRCMEIIDELEPVARGPYTGSFGYIGFSGTMDLNIIIRTYVIKDDRTYVQAGAGIVADSDPEREYYESLSKAEALIETLKEI